jgi:hypothetical protein
MAQRATPQAGGSKGPSKTGIPGQAPAQRTIEPGTPAGAVGPGPHGEAGDARDRQVAQSTAAGSARVPEIPDDVGESNKPQRPAHATTPREREPKARGETMIRPSVPPIGPAVIVKDLRKTPRLTGEAGKGMRDSPIEAGTEDEAIEIANARGRAVLTPGGWVCPTIVKERVA